jgi:hypothetical protein
MWETMKSCASDESILFVMDLFRPGSRDEARRLVEEYAGDEPAVLKEDFFNSLCASFRTEEVGEQLKRAGLEYLQTEVVSDRHFIVYGQR